MKIVADLSVTSAPRTTGRWLPARLFRDAAEGGWYDVSDLKTVFQDSAGAAAGAVGAPVGLVLDLSQGLARGENVGTATDHTLSGGAAYASYDPLAEVYSISRDAGGSGTVFFHGVDPDAYYEIDLEVLDGAGGAAVAMRNSSSVLTSVGPGHGRTTRILRFPSGSIRMDLPSFPLATGFRIHAIRKLFGHHLVQATAAARPTLQQDAGGRYYLDFDGVDDILEAPFEVNHTFATLSVGYQSSVGGLNGGNIFGVGTGVAGRFYLVPSWGRARGLRQPQSGDVLANAQPVPVEELQLVTLRAGPGSEDLSEYVNGSAVPWAATGLSGMDLTSQKIHIGGRFPGNGHTPARIWGAVYITRALSNEELSKLDRFLATKTGVSLP